MTRTVAEYVELITYVGIRSVWSASAEMLTRSLRATEEVPMTIGFVISWVANGVGFGELTFRNDGTLTVDSEYMTPEFVEAVMIKFARTAKDTCR